MYLFKNYLFFDLYKTIVQIKEEEESSNENSSKIIGVITLLQSKKK